MTTRHEAGTSAHADPMDLASAVGVWGPATNATERDRYDPSLELAFERVVRFGCRIEGV